MKRPYLNNLIAGIIGMLFVWCSMGVAMAGDFLDPEQAFKVQVQLQDKKTVQVSWVIAPGYHLYRDRLSFNSSTPATLVAGAPILPAGKREFDSNFNKEMEIYQDKLVVDVPLQAGADATGKAVFILGYQGCADAGLCYPPIEKKYALNLDKPGILTEADAPVVATADTGTAAKAASTASSGSVSTTSGADDDSSLVQRTLASGSLWRIAIAFLVFGLLLSFTPCVLPMVPILSSIIVGEGVVSKGRGFALALAYSLGMALVYTSLGVAAGLAGEGLAAALQKPWVLLGFGFLLVLLSLSMFDVYQLQMPGALQSRLSASSGKLQGGKLTGVFIMGALSALIVGPCVAGPLAGALLYISQTRNVMTGAWALFSMAVGMSAPLLLTGVSAGSLLPRAGNWMNGVKKLFGLLLIAVAIWMVSPVFPVTVMMAAWGAFLILCAMMLHVFNPLTNGAGIGSYSGKALGLVCLILGLLELVGAASKGSDVLQPLAHWHAAAVTTTARAGEQHGTEKQFTRVRNLAELEQALAKTSSPVMLDFYADWCVACKEMERFTFSDSKISQQMQGMQLLQIDVTANNDDDRAMMKKFQLFGPPGIIFFDKSGKEIPQSRVIGFLEARLFNQHLDRYLGL
ncbi:protein-disulfide reductase DsbD [Undibacterium sp. TS12]|uniref:protein-disulfide reductase DsbD n=1 Tax=Undibacterium sp. TS12 TaxID=2908202 RepID=UPI001F4D06FC|nr:protein-disulfide reductase DsbD [Undibacterium sp. TS12]MCH8617549.1 protein-disulfide reductase DsbD [Undibacterium sp. TS12]